MTPHCHKSGLSVKYMTMNCHSYTWHSAQSYDYQVSFLYLTLSPVLWQWGVFPILDTQPSLMTMKCHSYTVYLTQPILMSMKCHSYTWYTVHSYDNEVSFLYLIHSPFLWQCGVIPILDTQPSLMTMGFHSYTWHSAQSYDYEVSFLYLTLSPVLWLWCVIPIQNGLCIKYRNDTSLS
jgi:hypothetical protein